MAEGRSAIAKLLKVIQTWLPLLKRDIPGSDAGNYGDKPGVRLEFLAAYEREAATIDALFPEPENEALRRAYFHDRQDHYELESTDVKAWFSTGTEAPVKPS